MFESMKMEEEKIELAKLILSLENASLIHKLKDLIMEETGSFKTGLNAEEKKELALGIAQLDRGEKISVQDFLNKVS